MTPQLAFIIALMLLSSLLLALIAWRIDVALTWLFNISYFEH